MKVQTSTPFLAGAPGESVVCRVRVENDSDLPAGFQLRVVGFDQQHVVLPPSNGALAAGATTEVDVQLTIPDAFAPGNHSLGVEVRSDRGNAPPSLAPVTVSVGSLSRLLLTVNPSTVRGSRSAKFWVDVLNRDDHAIDLDLTGESPGLRIRVKPRRITVAGHQRTRARGKVTGRLRLVGESRQQPFAVSARSHSAPTFSTGTFLQRPLIPRPLRLLTMVLMALALWATVLAGALVWWDNRSDDDQAQLEGVELVDIDGDGTLDMPADQLVDTDGDGVPDTPAGEVAAQAAAEEPADEEPAEEAAPPATTTRVIGTVLAGTTGQNEGVLVTLTPIELGAQPSPEAQAFAGAQRTKVTKLWPARYGSYAAAGATAVRQTTSVTDVSQGIEGAFFLPDVLIRQTYEVNFAKAGFDSQSFVITPPENGDPVEMEVVLDPSDGELGGRIVGPGGALGNVEIVATDGTLTFNTTSSSDPAQLGQFALPAVNTPATYTITATLRGFGTEVIQVPLDPGQRRNDLLISMQPGVGSIVGHVTANGAPLGGVTMTVSNGDVTRTTTSLTEGDIGLYNFPQLPVPGSYTVTASSPGHITQTRLLTLAGNVTDVDFDLVTTTAAITGLVVSNVEGPLPGASISITRDDLTFRALSAAAPQPGAFTVDDLPPGTYLIRFTRFDHAETSQLVTLAAGEVRDLGQIRLTFTGVPDLPSTGSVNVSVVDSQGAALRGATVRLVDVSTLETIALISDDDDNQSTFLFEDVPVGTYNVVVDRRLYRNSSVRVSVGLGPQTVTVQMFLLGQVNGRIVDSLTNQQLDDYAVSIFRINPDDSSTFVEQVSVRDGQPPDPLTGELRWESSPNLLTTGTYRIEVTDPPNGYRVVNDQSVDPNRPANPPMQFEILPTAEDPLALNDIEADPFPNLTGRIFKPLLVDPLTDEVDFAPIDDDGLSVVLTCPEGPAPVPGVLSDDVPAVPGLDSYSFDPITLEQNNMFGACVIQAGAPGFVTTTVTMEPPLLPSDGETRSDQVVNLAIVAPNDPIAGSVLWLDRGFTPPAERPIDGVNLVNEDGVIVGFERAQGTDPAAEPTPIVAPSGTMRSRSIAGSWSLTGQVFGRAIYEFLDTSRFPVGRMAVTIDESTTRQVEALSNLTVEDRGAAGGGIRVVMQPFDGRIFGSVQIQSVQPVRYSDATIRTLGPGGSNPQFSPDPTTGTFAVNPATAGTWSLTTSIDGNGVPTDLRDYTLVGGSPTVFTPLVEPNATVSLPPTAYVEHPRIDVLVLDTNGNPIDEGGVVPTVTINSPGVGPTTQAVDPTTGRSTFRRLRFDPVNPTVTGVTYTFSVAMPGYDLTQGSASAVGNGATNFTVFALQPVGGAITLRAGAKPVITIRLPKFGSLSGNVIGRIGGLDTDPTEPLSMTDPQLTVTARRVLSIDPFRNTPGSRFFNPVFDAPIAAIVDPNDPTGFRVSGPPGVYVFDVRHTQFQPVPVAVPEFPPDCPFYFFFGCPAGAVPRDLLGGQSGYLIENSVDTEFATPYVLEITRMLVNVRVISSRATQNPVTDVTVRLDHGAPYDQTLSTGPINTVTFGGIIPGTNALTARRLSGTGADLNYPALASLDIPRFNTTNGGSVDLTIVMPELGNRFGGQITAINADGDPIQLPADVVIDRVYLPPAVDVDGASVDNDAREAQAPAGDVVYDGGTGPPTQQTVVAGGPDPLAPQPLETPQPFEFGNVAAGVHTVTFSDEAGYTQPSPNPRTVPVVNGDLNDLGPIVYEAENVTITVAVTSLGDPLTTATVRLRSPDVGEEFLATGAGGTYTFAPVPPELADYTLEITDPLHTTVTQPLVVSPDADGVLVIPTIAMVGSGARISGLAQREPGTGPVPLAGQGTVALQLANGTPVATATPSASGAYAFTVTAAGNYRVVVSFAGYATRTSANFAVQLGQNVAAPTVTIPALASAVITVTDVLPEDASTIAVTVTQPTGSGLTATRAGDVFTVAGLDPDVAYRFRVTATGYQGQNVPTTGTLDPSPGTAHPFTVVMDQRRVVVTVETEDNVQSAERGATVVLRIPAGGAPISPTSRIDNEYRFARVSIGAGQVTVDASGYRTRVVDVDASADNVRITANLLKLATISGVVRRADGTTPVAGITVTATSGATSTSAVTNASGQYSIPNLDVGTWAIATTQLGLGTATASVVVDANSASAVTRDLTLAPRNVTVTFTVSAGTPPAALAGATVNVDGVALPSPTTNTSGVATIAAPENGPLVWTVAAANRITQTGTITLASLAASVTITLVDRPTLTGTVTSAGADLAAANVYLCPAAAATCNATTAVANTTSDANGDFSFRPDIGTWQVAAVFSGRSGTITGITVAAAGTVTPNAITVVVPPPPAP